MLHASTRHGAGAAVWVAILLSACGSRTTAADAGAADAGHEPDGGPPPACPCDAEDRDGDGALGGSCGTDCDDEDPAIHPGAADVAGDGLDRDCDGADGVDRDGDGFVAAAGGGDDCDDTLAFVRPDAPDGRGWAIQVFDAGVRTQLALDPWGKPVVLYASWGDALPCPDDEIEYQDGTTTVEIARWERGTWTSELVERACTKDATGSP